MTRKEKSLVYSNEEPSVFSCENCKYEPLSPEAEPCCDCMNSHKNYFEAKTSKVTETAEEKCKEDCVSREEVLNLVRFNAFHVKSQIKAIENMPSVYAPTRKWIPVIEKLPEEETKVLVCNEKGDIEISMGSYSTELEGYFDWYTSGWRFGQVIAWMPLPDPYKAEMESEE